MTARENNSSPSDLNYDDPEVEARWNAERRADVSSYLDGEGIALTQIGDVPAWSVAPFVSLWAAESSDNSGTCRWWVISGDLPNDYVSASKASTPRDAVNAIATLWAEAAEYMARGEAHPTFVIGSGDRAEELAPLLASRAALLLKWVEDPEAW